METVAEMELIERAQAQDHEAMDSLMRQYKSLVRKRARSLFIIGGDQDDLMQEGMIGLFKAIQDYDRSKETGFASFAELCISRQLYSAVKSSNRKKNIPLNTYVSIYSPAYIQEDGAPGEDLIVDRSMETIEMSPEEILIDRENAENLRKRIYQHLSSLEQEVLSLYLEGMAYQEIARELRREPKSIDNALQRIKSKVNKTLQERV